jgi:hypothetical protein
MEIVTVGAGMLPANAPGGTLECLACHTEDHLQICLPNLHCIEWTQEVMEMVSEQADLYDWFGRIASTLEWTVTYAGGPHILQACALFTAQIYQCGDRLAN